MLDATVLNAFCERSLISTYVYHYIFTLKTNHKNISINLKDILQIPVKLIYPLFAEALLHTILLVISID